VASVARRPAAHPDRFCTGMVVHARSLCSYARPASGSDNSRAGYPQQPLLVCRCRHPAYRATAIRHRRGARPVSHRLGRRLSCPARTLARNPGGRRQPAVRHRQSGHGQRLLSGCVGDAAQLPGRGLYHPPAGRRRPQGHEHLRHPGCRTGVWPSRPGVDGPFAGGSAQRRGVPYPAGDA